MTYTILDAAAEQANPFVQDWVELGVERLTVHFLICDPMCQDADDARDMAMEVMDKITNWLQPAPLSAEEAEGG